MFGSDMAQLWSAAPAFLWFLDFLPNTVWGWIGTIGSILAGAGLLLGHKTRLAGIVWAIILIINWNAIGRTSDVGLLITLIGSIIAAFMWGGDFSLEKMLKWTISKTGAVTWAVAGGIWWVWNVVKGTGSVIWDSVGKVADTATKWAADLANKASDAVSTATKKTKAAAEAASNTAKEVSKDATDTAEDVTSSAKNTAKWVGGMIWWLAEGLGGMAGWAIDKAGDAAKWAVTQIADKIDAATGWVASGIIDKVEDMAEDIIDKAEDMVEEVIDVE